MVKTFTMVNQRGLVQELKDFVNKILIEFEVGRNFDDLFYYGTFLKLENYVNFDFKKYSDEGKKFEIPNILLDDNTSCSEKSDFIYNTIREILVYGLDKPEWMRFVEINDTFSEYNLPPSNYLYVQERKPEYIGIRIALDKLMKAMANETDNVLITQI